MRRTLTALLLSAVVPLSAHAQTTIISVPSAFAVPGFGTGFFPQVGQTFTVPGSAPYLQSFAFFLGDEENGGDLRFDFTIHQFDGAGISSGPLGTIEGQIGSTSVDALVRYDFLLTNLRLNPGAIYVALMTATSPTGFNVVGAAADSWYGGGSLVVGRGEEEFDVVEYDAGFEAVFTPSAQATVVPEPGTFLLVGLGLATLGLALRRHRAIV